jgi:hypothetical protein
MPTGGAPSVVAKGTLVTIRWPAATFANGAPVAGYIVARYDAATGAVQPIGAAQRRRDDNPMRRKQRSVRQLVLHRQPGPTQLDGQGEQSE